MKLADLHEGMMKRSDPKISGDIPGYAPTVQKTAHVHKLEALVKQSGKTFAQVEKIWNDTANEVGDVDGRWRIVMAKVMQHIGLTEEEDTMYYHGTAREDTAFADLGEHWRGGIYFTHRHRAANIHATCDAECEGGTPKIVWAHLKFSSPKHMDGIDSHEFTHADIKEFQDEGYDAVINGDETIVFRTSQIEVVKVEVIKPQDQRKYSSD